MHATIRRYEGVDMARTNEVTGKVNEKLVPELRKLPGFAGYYLIEAGNGVLSSLNLFETADQADESSKIVAKWIADENLDTAIPERSEDHVRQGRCSQQWRGRRRVTQRSSHTRRGPGCAGPSPRWPSCSPGRLRGFSARSRPSALRLARHAGSWPPPIATRALCLRGSGPRRAMRKGSG